MDKFRKTSPLSITFSDGEQPTGPKLTALATQARQSTALLESAIGDPWNQSGDASLNDNYLQIPNLARMLGENRYLSPPLYPGIQTFRYTQKIGVDYEGQSEGKFRYAPTEGTSGAGGVPTSYVIDTDTNVNFVDQVANEYDVNVAGEFWVDVTTGRFRIFAELDSLDEISYSVNPEAATGWVVGDETLPGIIPDPRQSDFTGLRVSASDGKYFIHLPPRRPLTLTARETPSGYPPAAEISNNEASSVGSPYRYWQYGTAALTGANSEHYRYQLPQDIIDTLGSLAAGTELPAGFMFLWDTTNNTIIEGIVFKKPSAPGFLNYVIEVESSYDFSALVSTDEAEDKYSATNIALITCGSPLARSHWTLSSAFFRHSHDNSGTMEAAVSHNDLADLNPPLRGAPGHSTRYPAALLNWGPSRWANDSHTSLLSRGGSQSVASTDHRDLNDNAMLGDLVLANTVATAGIFLDATNTNNSFKLYFGASGGPSIYGFPGTKVIRIDGTISRTAINLSTGALTVLGSVQLAGTVGNTGIISTGGMGGDENPTGNAGGYGGWFIGGIGGDGSTNGQIGGTGIRGDGAVGGTGASDQVGGGSGVKGTGARQGNQATSGVGGHFTGGARTLAGTAAFGVYAAGGANSFSGGHAGAGISSLGGNATTDAGDGGVGIIGQGGTSATGIGGAGVKATGGNAAVGGNFTGGTGNTNGADGLGIGTGSGFVGEGGSSNGIGMGGTGGGANGIGVYGFSADSGPGVFGQSVNGYGVEAESDTTGTPNKSALRIAPQDEDPSSAAAGDVYVNSDTGRMSVHNGTEWNRNVGQSFASVVSSTPITGTALEGFDEFYVIPGNSLRVGSVIRIRAHVFITDVSGSGTLSIDMFFGDQSTPSGNLIFRTYPVPTPVNQGTIIINTTLVVTGIGSNIAFTATSFYSDGTVAVSGSPCFGQERIMASGLSTTTERDLFVAADWQNNSNSCVLKQLVVDIT